MSMDATTIERLKHAQEVLGWIAGGNDVQCSKNGKGPFVDATWFAHFDRLARMIVEDGDKYRLKPAKTIRPFTEQEARRLVGCVIVEPDGCSYVCSFLWEQNSLKNAAHKRWHYHLPGDPDNLKPCWVEE